MDLIQNVVSHRTCIFLFLFQTGLPSGSMSSALTDGEGQSQSWGRHGSRNGGYVFSSFRSSFGFRIWNSSFICKSGEQLISAIEYPHFPNTLTLCMGSSHPSDDSGKRLFSLLTADVYGFPLFQKSLHSFFLIIGAEALGAALGLQTGGAIQRLIIAVINAVLGHFQCKAR